MIHIILAIIIGIIVWALYHQIFNVAYFGLGAFFKEIWICFIIGYFVIGKLFGWV